MRSSPTVVRAGAGLSPPDQTRRLGLPGQSALPPVWSPDGGSLIGLAWVFDSDPSDDAPGLFLHDLSTNEIRTPEIGRERGAYPPAWSPNGLLIAFSSSWAGNHDVYVGAGPDAEWSLLVGGACDEIDPRWLGDSDTLLVRRVCEETTPIDLVVDVGTGVIVRTVEGLANWAELSPDGTTALWTEPVVGRSESDLVMYDLAQQRVIDRFPGDGPRWRPPVTEE